MNGPANDISLYLYEAIFISFRISDVLSKVITLKKINFRTLFDPHLGKAQAKTSNQFFLSQFILGIT